MKITMKNKGNFSKTTEYLKGVSKIDIKNIEQYGVRGVEALKKFTPKNTGKTANSWDYVIIKEKTKITLSFVNSNIQNGIPIAIILQYGHGTGNGGYVEGIDYINPAIQPLFNELAEQAWKEVNRR